MNSAALRTLVIYGLILPFAVFVGWMLSDTMTMTSFSVLAAIVFVLLLPALLKWHHIALVLSWNTSISIFFLPGKPTSWLLLGALNFGIAIFYRIIQKRNIFISTPSLTVSLLILTAIVVMTGKLRGGFGMQSLGSSTQGGKFYYYILGAIIAYFGLISYRIPLEKAKTYLGMFFLPAIIAAVSNLIYFAGPSFYVLYAVFPAGFAGVQASTDYSGIVRVAGFWVAGSAVGYYLLAVHGIRGVLQKWWRPLILIVALVLGTMGGYRSLLLMFALLFVVLFVLEGLIRSPIFPAIVIISILGFLALVPTVRLLPNSIQRTLSVLPLDVNPMVRMDAQGSLDWRVRVWRAVIPDLPKYFWLGKGYQINPTDLYLTEQARKRGRSSYTEGIKITGDYHNGPLSVYVPFGFFGSLAFLGFLTVALRALYMNYRYGPEQLRIPNRFLFAFFIAKTIFFFAIFGSLHSDMIQFLGPLGLGVALNGGICRKPAVTRPVVFRGVLRAPTRELAV